MSTINVHKYGKNTATQLKNICSWKIISSSTVILREERKRERGAVTVELAIQLSALLQISYHMVLFQFKSEKLKKSEVRSTCLAVNYFIQASSQNLLLSTFWGKLTRKRFWLRAETRTLEEGSLYRSWSHQCNLLAREQSLFPAAEVSNRLLRATPAKIPGGCWSDLFGRFSHKLGLV